MQGSELFQNTRHPCGEAGEGGEVEQEFRRRKSAAQCPVDQIHISDAVSGKAQNHIYHTRPGVDPLPAVNKGLVQGQNALVQIIEPIGKAKDADILRQADGFGLALDIAQFFVIFRVFLPVAVAPLMDALADEEANGGGHHNNRNQEQVQVGKQRQIHRKTGDVQQNHGQRTPDMLCGFGIAGAKIHGLLLKIQYFRIPGVGVGCGAGLGVDVQNNRGTQANTAKQNPFLQIAQQSVQYHQCQGEDSDGSQKFREWGQSLYLFQDSRGDEQLG